MAQDKISITLSSQLQRVQENGFSAGPIPVSVTTCEDGDPIILINNAIRFKHSELTGAISRIPSLPAKEKVSSSNTEFETKTIGVIAKVGAYDTQRFLSGINYIGKLLGAPDVGDLITESYVNSTNIGFTMEIPEQHINTEFMEMFAGIIQATSSSSFGVVIAFKGRNSDLQVRGSFGLSTSVIGSMKDKLVEWYF